MRVYLEPVIVPGLFAVLLQVQLRVLLQAQNPVPNLQYLRTVRVRQSMARHSAEQAGLATRPPDGSTAAACGCPSRAYVHRPQRPTLPDVVSVSVVVIVHTHPPNVCGGRAAGRK
eukprot:361464-Chlamydomonas_euryale.AAC.2